jgi:curved DNA-binding protein CbpA
MTDYYEFLQISHHADMETIHRVYRFLAARFHPDNPSSGDAEQFRLLKIAYDTLSDPARRAEYDSKRKRESPEPFSTTVDFMDTLDGELNRRLAVLAVLYHRRRTNALLPEVSLNEIEDRMGFPRDYLDFTLWYLQKKGFVGKADNAQYTLTAEGVDFVEKHRIDFPTLQKMLTSGAPGGAPQNWTERAPAEYHGLSPEKIILPHSMDAGFDRRNGKHDRRVGAPDKRTFKKERRVGSRDRRAKAEDLPAAKAEDLPVN